MDPEEAERRERARIEERLTLRHKGTSKWARRAQHRGAAVMDAGTKEALKEQLRLAEELKRKVEGARGSDSDASTQVGLEGSLLFYKASRSSVGLGALR